MTEMQTNQYRPITVTPPGSTLADILEERGIRQTELAARMEVTPKFINELVGGKASISPVTALALERALDVPADFWLARDARYQEQLAREQARGQLESQIPWLKELPVKDMRRFGWLPECSTKAEVVSACLQYFGVVSVEAWRTQYVDRTSALAAYRMSKSTNAAQGAIAAWLRQGELEAAKIVCKSFDRAEFMVAVDAVRALTCQHDPKVFVPQLERQFSQCGVAVVFVRAPMGCPISGAVRWLTSKKALIQLSFRYMRNDSLWFTFFHECGHIYLHGKKMMFLEDGEISNQEENEANRFAADKLIPAHDWEYFRSTPHTEIAIRQFAAKLGIHPGIVVGRLQNENLLDWNRFSHLKVRYRWKEPE